MLDSFLARWIRPQPEPIVHDQSQDIGITITRTTTTTDDTGLPCSIQRPARSEKSPFSSIVRTKSKLKAKWKGENIKIGAGSDGGLSISHPIAYPSPLSLTGFGPDTPGSLASGSERWYPQPPYAVSSSQSSPTRYGPSNVEWKISAEEEQLEDIDMDSRRRQAILIPTPPPPAVVRVPGSQSEISRADHTSHFIGRSASAPLLSVPMEEPTQSYPDTSLAPSSKGTLKVNIASYHQDTASAITPSVSTDVYNNAYNYPLAKQLSPIIEQDYSPVSLRTPTRGHGSQGSQGSITLSTSSMGAAKFSSSHPFLTRPLNRTISQTSSHTQGSSSSSVPRVSPFTSGSSFPTLGLHTSDHTSLPPDPPLAGSPLKIEHSYNASMPRISGSSESGLRNEYVNKDGDEASEVWGGEGDYTRESLHAESFVTASDVHGADEMGFWTQRGEGTKELEMEVAEAHLDGASTTSLHPQTNLSAIALNAETVNQNDNFQGNTSANTSTSSSYVPIHWDRDAALGTGVVGVTFKPPHTWLADRTPAFWTFWVGFIFPILWLVGGWHFTSVGECPARVGMWEFYFFGRSGAAFRRAFRWVGIECGCCCGARNKYKMHDLEANALQGKSVQGEEESKQEVQGPRLPRWVTEKQSSDLGRQRLQDPKRSLRGISFGYPFVPRPPSMRQTLVSLVLQRPRHWRVMVMQILTKPHRIFDCFYGVRLREVRGRPESGRRVFDPWIQRCRYAFCYALLGLCAGLCIACTLLIVVNTREIA